MASALTQVFSLQLINQLNQRHTVLQASFIMDELIRWRIKTMTVQYVIITVMTNVFLVTGLFQCLNTTDPLIHFI